MPIDSTWNDEEAAGIPHEFQVPALPADVHGRSRTSLLRAKTFCTPSTRQVWDRGQDGNSVMLGRLATPTWAAATDTVSGDFGPRSGRSGSAFVAFLLAQPLVGGHLVSAIVAVVVVALVGYALVSHISVP
jgi:hypothetical protein